MAAKLRVPSFHLDFGPSFDGVTVKDDNSPGAGIKGRRSFGSRCVYRVILVVLELGWVDLDFGCSTVCPTVPGAGGNYAEVAW